MGAVVAVIAGAAGVGAGAGVIAGVGAGAAGIAVATGVVIAASDFTGVDITAPPCAAGFGS
ncbi:MAG: hypothetical protein ABI854_02885, partial [Betaproteobacteria bacterium]